MKYRTQKVTETTEHTIDGVTKPVTITREVRVPRLPRDWDVIAVRTASGMVLALTGISVAWSTWSIGALLHGGIGYGAATIFDVAWAVTLILEWLARFDPAKRRFPRVLGWMLLLATMGAIYWHGMTMHSVALAVVGAAVSLFAKVLWLAVMRHVDRDLSPEDAQWVAQVTSDAHARMAVASVRRQVARIEDRAAAELLALESERGITGEQLWPVRNAVPEAVTEAVTNPVADVPELVPGDVTEPVTDPVSGLDVSADHPDHAPVPEPVAETAPETVIKAKAKPVTKAVTKAARKPVTNAGRVARRMSRDERRDAITAHLKKYPDATPTELRKVIGGRPETIRELLAELSDTGSDAPVIQLRKSVSD